MPDISPSEMGLFRISRELQFRVCTCGEPLKDPAQQEKEDAFIQGKGSWEGCSKQRVHGFLLAETMPRKKRSLSSSSWALLPSQGVRAPSSGFSALYN